MANTFKNKGSAAVGTSLTTVYTVPNATTATVIGLALANIVSSNVTVSVQVEDVSAAASYYLVRNAPVPVGSSLVVIGGDQKVVLETGDKIKIQSSASTSIDAFLSMLELS